MNLHLLSWCAVQSQCLRKGCGSSIIFVYQIAVWFPPNRPSRESGARPPSDRSRWFGSAPGAWLRPLGNKPRGLFTKLARVTSLRHVSLRETGWSRNPTSSGRLRPGSKGKATHGEEVRNPAFPSTQVFRTARTQSASQREPAKTSASPQRRAPCFVRRTIARQSRKIARTRNRKSTGPSEQAQIHPSTAR